MARSWMGSTQYQTWRQSSTIYMGPHTLAKLTSLMPTIKLNLTQKNICTINASHRLLNMCQLTQRLKNSSSFIQNCIESTLKRVKVVLILQDDIRVFGTTKEQFDKNNLAVESTTRQNFTHNEKKFSSKQGQKSCLDTPIQRREYQQIPNSLKK